MQIALEFDDFSPRNNQFGLLGEMRDHYPTLKVTMFTIPWDTRSEDPQRIIDTQYHEWVLAVRKAIREGWLEIAVHGLNHWSDPEQGRFEWNPIDYDEARARIVMAERLFRKAQIPYVKIFKAPHWELSKQGKKALEDVHNGTREQLVPEYDGKPFGGFQVVEDHYYNWNLADHRPQEREIRNNEIIITHGHVQDVCRNGIHESFDKLTSLPTDTTFLFLSEALHAKAKKAKRATRSRRAR